MVELETALKAFSHFGCLDHPSCVLANEVRKLRQEIEDIKNPKPKPVETEQEEIKETELEEMMSHYEPGADG